MSISQTIFHFCSEITGICQIIAQRRLTQTKAAEIMGLDQPKVSKLLRGHHRGYSSDRLLHILNLLGQDVIITVVSIPLASEPRLGHISVAMAQRP